jgi:hypothetical protein
VRLKLLRRTCSRSGRLFVAHTNPCTKLSSSVTLLLVSPWKEQKKIQKNGVTLLEIKQNAQATCHTQTYTDTDTHTQTHTIVEAVRRIREVHFLF